MLKRKIYDSLVQWKNKPNRMPLLVKGARQIGKTTTIREFAVKNYNNIIEINFEKTPEIKTAFRGNLDVNTLIEEISLKMPEAKFVPSETLIFFDEIQACGQAHTSLKFWAEDGRFDVIASGSLLGIMSSDADLAKDMYISSYPVGYEEEIMMYGMDFEEFLWAAGVDEAAISRLYECFEKEEKISPASHETMMKYFRTYMVVGGMPAVVSAFVQNHNYAEVHDIQGRITADYRNDIAHYAKAVEKVKARRCFDNIPAQLSKENTKFQYSVVEKKATAKKYRTSLEWLRDAEIITFCNNLSLPAFPAEAYKIDEEIRAYMTDTGLLIYMYGFEMKDAVMSDTLKGPAKGGIYENAVAALLHKKGYRIYYYRAANHGVEIEFILPAKNEAAVIPVEVKANRGSTVSLNKILENEDIKIGYKLTSGNLGRAGKKLTLPLYMAMFL